MIDTKVKSKNVSSLMKLNKQVKGKISLLTNGLSAKEIADLMATSVNTINNQKNTLLEKSDYTNITDLVIKLAHMGLISV
jgi:DNA-binding NarL/FixJ family response regulator